MAVVGAILCELVLIVAVDAAGEGQAVFQDHQGFIGDLGNREQIICHDLFPLFKN